MFCWLLGSSPPLYSLFRGVFFCCCCFFSRGIMHHSITLKKNHLIPHLEFPFICKSEWISSKAEKKREFCWADCMLSATFIARVRALLDYSLNYQLFPLNLLLIYIYNHHSRDWSPLNMNIYIKRMSRFILTFTIDLSFFAGCRNNVGWKYVRFWFYFI